MNIETKQTAVEWLFKDQNMDDFDTIMLYQIAKQMEKEQIINAYKNGCIGEMFEMNTVISAEQYYKETYEKD